MYTKSDGPPPEPPTGSSGPRATPRPSSAERVYQDLKRQILDGELTGGDMLGEQAVADQLGVSRTPVREAIGRLQAEGWLRVHPRRGAVITSPGPDERRDVIDARALLESHGLRVAVDAGRAGALAAQLRTLLAGQRTAHEHGDLDSVAALDAAFHAAIVAAAGNAVLDAAFMTISDRQQRMTTRALWRHTEVSARVITDHEDLIGLVDTQDAAGFATALERHMHEVHG
jgi:DNA-binding GntR family transcriptional regulator